ncbi:phosphohistidine phosphatase [Propionibacterium cyclohexanicum]|uniref:Phosphohistidine phosphatase n=1 Tax=Propionibacterium cyclohexanicum TaxID=64702 RepID=A0A1H9RUZ8_9ACTN|nr:histidine phosphatase family protein [Propionibacterium cyclohexanicum]SER76622.1 phosphohistidine phosphatase [Propionibacterium cyclohexanicum]
MSRTLYLMRHAQAKSSAIGGDAHRPLTRRGREEARAAGVLLADAHVDLALVSAATRAQETFDAMGLRRPDGSPVPAQVLDALYNSGTTTLRQRIAQISDDVDVLLVIAHAPGIPALATEFTWAHSGLEADLAQAPFPTATLAAFSLDGSWSQIGDFDAYSYTDPRSPRDSPLSPLGGPRTPRLDSARGAQ